MKIGIFLPNWIGDVVMATPALRAVRTRFPDASIFGIMRPYVADVIAGTGLIDDTLFYNPRGTVKAQRGWGFIRQLRAQRLDSVLLLTNSLRTAWLAWLSGARERTGFARDLRGWLLTDRIAPRPRSIPHSTMDEYLRLTNSFCSSSRSDRLQGNPQSQVDLLFNPPPIELAVLPQDQENLDQFWNSGQRIATNRQAYVCLNTGGAFGAAKNWPREHFVELARRIVQELDRAVLIVCGPAEREDAAWIAAKAGHPAINSLAGSPLSIGLTKAAIRECELLVTTDSGPRHFAAAFGRPVITLFGPTHITWSETHYEKAEHLQLKLDCGPCQQRDCPLKHHRCMKELSVDQVYAAVRRQLSRHSSRRHVA